MVYGPTLGPKLWEVPDHYRVNWFIVVTHRDDISQSHNDFMLRLLGGYGS